MRTELLPALPSGSPDCATRRHLDVPCRISLHQTSDTIRQNLRMVEIPALVVAICSENPYGFLGAPLGKRKANCNFSCQVGDGIESGRLTFQYALTLAFTG